MNKNLIASAIVGLGLAASGSASAIVVAGVDFGATGAVSHLETTTLAETLVTGNGQQLTGYGQINTVNGNISYAGSDRLYFVFDNYISQNFSATSTDFSGGQVRVYLRPSFNLLDQSSAANFSLIQTGTPYAILGGHGLNGTTATLKANGVLTGTTLSFSGQGLLDVTGGLPAVQAYLNSNGIGDGAGGFADIVLTTSGNNAVLNPFDNTTGCLTGQAQAGQFCIAGSADLRGLAARAVPEPGVLGLVGLGLVGMGISLRKRKAA
jgi:hypothetical protein